jgi:hypothetical protein
MSEVANEKSEVESVEPKASEPVKPPKAEKKPAKKPAKEAVSESTTPSPRKSVYWPSVRSFLDRETVAEVVKAACDRVGVVEPKECEKSESSFGSMRDVLEAVAMLDSSNVDEADMNGLAECLFLLSK